MLGDDDLFISKLFTKDFEGLLVVGRRESEPSNSFKGCAIKKGK